MTGLRSVGETSGRLPHLNGVDVMAINRNSVFWAAFWTGLASPVSVYAAPVTYYPYLGNYSVPLSFTQVGFALGHSYAQASDDGQPTAGTSPAAT
jgi:hypothetical protein